MKKPQATYKKDPEQFTKGERRFFAFCGICAVVVIMLEW